MNLGTTRFGYDPMGNLTTRGSQSLVYDAEGRLTSVSSASLGSETYRYDGDGGLVKRTLTTAPTVASYRDPLASGNANWTATTSVGWGVNVSGSHTTTLRLAGNGTDWANQVYRSGAALSDGHTARLAFKLSQTGSGAVLALESGDWSNYIGVYEAGGTLYLRTRLGATFSNVLTLTTGLDPTAWYGLELGVDDAAGMRVTTWQEGAEGTRYEARYEMPRGLSWRFHTWIKSGTVWLDGSSASGYAYQEERPSGTAVGRTTAIVGKHYEETPSVSLRVKRYYANGALLATRQTYYGSVPGTEVTYVQGDHLGSTSTLTNWAGAVVGRERYSAFGERRRSDSAAITDQLYTGQRLNVLSGLYHYSDGRSAGRFYDPLLARFVQADPVTPPGSQGLNRFSYTLNNPLRYIDPSGHEGCAADDNQCWQDEAKAKADYYRTHGYEMVNGGWTFTGRFQQGWIDDDDTRRDMIRQFALDLAANGTAAGEALARITAYAAAFYQKFSPLEFFQAGRFVDDVSHVLTGMYGWTAPLQQRKRTQNSDPHFAG